MVAEVALPRQTLTFGDLATYIQTGLITLGYRQNRRIQELDAMPLFVPYSGAQRQRKLSPQAMVFVGIGGGSGLTTEHLYDLLTINILTIGLQGSYESAEKLAWSVDYVLLQAAGNTEVGDARVLYITRTGGAPTPEDYDSGNRYSFTGSYITEAKTDLVR